MRIIAGKLKYKRLHFKKDTKLRPTRSIVRKSLFDTLMSIIEGSVFLDMFAGTGSIGIEAVSRGAKKVIFVDNSKDSISLIYRNVGRFKNVDIVRSDAERFLDNPLLKEVTIAYIDPPYVFEISRFLEKFFDVINKEAVVCVEHDKRMVLQDKFGKFRKIKSRAFGKNILDYFGVEDE